MIKFVLITRNVIKNNGNEGLNKKFKFCLALSEKLGLESIPFESFKSMYLAASLVSKARSMNLLRRRATTADRAGLFSWNSLNFLKRFSFGITKLIEDFILFQDNGARDLKVDENVVRMQRRYSLE